MSARLGHATVAFTLDTYTDDIPELDQAAAQEISDLFLNTPGFGSDTFELDTNSGDEETDGDDGG